MKVINEKTENNQAFLTVEMEPAEVEESLEKSYQRLVQKRKVPGFRTGKAPRAILERYIGREGLLEEALHDLVPQSYEKAIKEQGIEAIAQPQIEITQTDPLVYKAVVPLKPNVKLGDYKHLQVMPQPATPVTENDINAVIEELRHRHAVWEPVERPVDFGDLVTLNIWSNIEDKPFYNRKGVQYQVLQNSSLPAPGFSEQLVGMKKDEEKQFKLQLPSEYARTELAGKEVQFRVRIDEIKKELLPEVNDAFAVEVNPDIKTVDTLRERASSDLKHRAEEQAESDFEAKLIEALVGVSQVGFPPILVEAEIDHLVEQTLRNSNQSLEAYLKSINKKEEELREELRPLATERIKRSLILGEVAEEEKIEISDSEVDNNINNVIKNATENKAELERILNTKEARESIRDTMITRKTIQRLVELAKGLAETKTIQEEKK